MPRYVLLLHECPGNHPRATHCDLMLEVGTALQTWALEKLPRDWQTLELSPQFFADSNSVPALRLADHRLAYLEYEGPVSGDRGLVRRLAAGEYHNGTSARRFILDGDELRGEVEIVTRSVESAECQLTYCPATSSAVNVCPST